MATAPKMGPSSASVRATASVRGTYDGFKAKGAYLNELGVTAVELLPIHEFDENDCPFVNPKTGRRNRNFWGYNTVAFAAPKGTETVDMR